MTSPPTDSAHLLAKQAVKEALFEAMDERREFFQELLSEVMEDIGMARAIEEGLPTGLADPQEVERLLRGDE